MTKASSSRGATAALIAVALWATNAYMATVALNQLSVLQLLTVQYGSAALVLGVWHAGGLARRREAAATGSRVSTRAVVTGVLGLTGTIFLQYWAFATAPVVGANVIAYGWPLMAALWVAATHRTRHTLVGVPLALLGFLGVAAIFSGQDMSGSGGAQIGYVIALGSAACMAFYTVAAGRIDASVTDLLLPATIVGTVAAATASLFEEASWPGLGQWWPAVYIGIGPMAAGYGLWTYAMADHRAERLGPIGYATPLLSTVLLLATGQPFTIAILVGAALILACSAGVLINERIAQRRAIEHHSPRRH